MPQNSEKIVVILSGGLDSTVLLYDMLHQGYDVRALTFNYGQKHSREIECAEKTCKYLQVPHEVLSLECLAAILQSSSLISSSLDVPEGHYQAENMKSTVVPNRNSIMLNIAMAYAINIGIRKIAYGAHAGDHAIYPDCRPEFVEAIQDLAKCVDYEEIEIIAPYLQWTKADIVKRGLGLNVNFALTYSCYKGGAKHCGKCGTCTERLEAFKLAHAIDPVDYETEVEAVSHQGEGE